MARIRLSLVSALSITVGAYVGSKYEKSQLNVRDMLNNWPRGSVFAATSSNLPANISTPGAASVAKISSEIMRLGLPSLDNLRTFDDFILSYDRRHRNSNWVFEHITRDKLKYAEGVTRENCDFTPDPNIHSYFAATNEDFKGTGYDRGHLAAAANHRWSQAAMQQTFTLSNISPQVGKGFNRDIWCSLEKFVRHQAKKFKNVYVLTGPLYLPRMEDGKLFVKYEVVGRNHVAVPTHFFKVVLMESESNQFEMISFLLPNQVVLEQATLRQYVVPVEAIERASGLLLFDKLQKNKFRQNNLQLLADHK